MMDGLTFMHHIAHLPNEAEQFALFLVRHNEYDEIIAVAKATPWRPGARPFLSGLHVKEGYRQKGIGRALIQYILETGYLFESLALYVHRNNAVARILYESMGFRPLLEDGNDIMYARFLRDEFPRPEISQL